MGGLETAAMLQRRPDMPCYLKGSLGARALYPGSWMYRILGSNEPETIWYAISSG
jgi:lipoprotein-anchoring transpeptidase ErfK/SrfK